jgi:hypothetical protein
MRDYREEEYGTRHPLVHGQRADTSKRRAGHKQDP